MTPPQDVDASIGMLLGGRYRLLELIGSGGQGAVYRARDERMPRDVAVKILHPLADPAARERFRAARERFLREVTLLAPLDHPNIVGALDCGGEDEMFLVMAFVPGVSLNDLLEKGSLPSKEVVALGIQLADGLAAAHAKGLMHRDLKPGNIRITPEGRLKILDFGLAKKIEELSSTGSSLNLTEAGSTPGTLPYMSPEQIRGERLDQRSDIYAAGAVLFEMATATYLYPGRSREALMFAIANDPPPQPRAINPLVPRELQSVILKALQKKPSDRFASAGDLLTSLRKLGQPRPVPMLWVVAVVVLGIALAAVIALQPHEPRKTRIAVLPFGNLSGDPAQDLFAEGMTRDVIDQLGALMPEKLSVIPYRSVMKYKKSDVSTRQVGKDLKVAYVLEGDLRTWLPLPRVNVALDRAQDETHVWSKSYDDRQADVTAVQIAIAKRIAQTVGPQFVKSGRITLPHSTTAYPEAREAYYRGRHSWSQRSPDSLTTAIDHFDQAIAIDSTYALAYAGKADAYTLLGVYGDRATGEVMPKAMAAAKRALELDEHLSEAYTSRAAILQDYAWDWSSAERDFRRSIALNPSNSTAHQWYATLLAILDRPKEAFTELERAVELEPKSAIVGSDLASFYFNQHRFDDAVAQYEQTLAMDRGFVQAWWGLALLRWHQGEFGAAVTALENATRISAGDDAARELRQAFESRGSTGFWQWWVGRLEAMAQGSYVSPYDFALAYMLSGDREKAMVYLDRAFNEHTAGLAGLRLNPMFDPLRSDPRFTRLIRRMGLKP